MGSRRELDLEETFREPLAVTCYLPVAERPFELEDDATGYLGKRPERVIVRGAAGSAHPKHDLRPAARAYVQPRPRPLPQLQPQPLPAPTPLPRRVHPRAATILTPIVTAPERFDLESLVVFWGVALFGSLMAIGIAAVW